ncbi:putative mitochondrial protein [Senna tora]|uniref:Putative mitochondrial protein n=1 Tax=Senna tora TaxID=362788 RepID=A0A834SFF7_9FABA|nr:putative mitochondrial protein [Senna tora]
MANSVETLKSIEAPSGSSSSNSEVNYRRDPLYLHPSDTSGVQLVPNQLTQHNYLIWSRSMIIALRSKNKLGFVDGSLKQPTDRSSDAYLSWSFVDSAVTRWLLNSMCTELYEAYMFTPTAHEIWKELEEKYGTSNRPQIFHIKKQLAALERGNDSLAVYSTKLKKLWDELHCLQPKPCGCTVCANCDCGSLKKIDSIYTANYVDQFLMGLGEAYENVVSNIHLMDPIPSYNKVYSMVARIEMQRSVTASASSSNIVEGSALMVKNNEQQKSLAEAVNMAVNNVVNSRFVDRKKEKASRYCNHCARTGHTAETCFKKHGYPEWFNEYKNSKKGKKSSDSVNAAIGDSNAGSGSKNVEMDKKAMAEIIQEELKKLMRTKGTSDESPISASYFTDFASNLILKTYDYFDDNDKGVKWIVDSGASSHVTGNKLLLFDTRKPKGKNTVQLPDGVVKVVELIGRVKVMEGITLENVLFVPDFKYNLMLPTALLKWRKPYEILHKKLPYYSLLRVFGCLCYATNLDPNKKKFDERAKRCVFVGYASGYKGFKLYDLDSKRMFVSRDVKFYEKEFPLKSVIDKCSAEPPSSTSLGDVGSENDSNFDIADRSNKLQSGGKILEAHGDHGGDEVIEDSGCQGAESNLDKVQEKGKSLRG